MIWHVVRLDMSSVEDATRTGLEQRLATLAGLEMVVWLQVARDIESPAITGLVSVLADEAALDAYRTHPDHVPVVADIAELGIPVTRLDVRAPLPPPATV